MKNQILSEEFSRMQKLAGIITEIKAIPPDKEKIRFFTTNKMKAYDSEDINPDDIINISKDIKVKSDYGFDTYLVNKVELKNGKKGYIWSKNEKFED